MPTIEMEPTTQSPDTEADLARFAEDEAEGEQLEDLLDAAEQRDDALSPTEAVEAAPEKERHDLNPRMVLDAWNTLTLDQKQVVLRGILAGNEEFTDTSKLMEAGYRAKNDEQ